MPSEQKSTQALIDNTLPAVTERLGALKSSLERFQTELKAAIDGQHPNELQADPVVVYRFTADPPVGAEDNDQKRLRHRFTDFRRLERNAAAEESIDALTRITYEHDELVNRSPICCGFIGVPERLILEAQRINQDKDRLKTAFAPLRGRQVKYTENGAQKKREATTHLLRTIQASDVNLQAAYRHLPIAEEPIRELRYMVIRTRKVTNETVANLRDYLRKTPPGKKAVADLARLNQLPDNELLARPSAYYDRLRLKIVLARTGRSNKRPNTRTKLARELPAELPLLFPILPSSVPPEVSPPTPWREPARRPPPRLEEMVVESLKYYRLKPAFRRTR